MKEQEYRRIEEYMKACMTDAAHDREHVYRVLRAALKIAETEPEADRDILTAACLLHDIGREKQYADPKVCHAEAGAEMARRFLLELGWEEDRVSHVSACIFTHRFRKGREPGSMEAKIFFDADKLDVCGAIGIARTLQYQGRVGEPLYWVDKEGNPLPGDPGEPDSFLKEYRKKLSKLYGRFYTPAAAEMAKGRRQIAEAFYQAVWREIHLTD
ncbi:MAG TPA: HD domain-containing protein [Candidatus Merdivicinus excrementipullorum]|uniref:HD domain-containing protein n=1 Tax=Candidatus Merdivicinus excrementipullorum TaxID=2840867 RepID=A0A9D1FKG1_9FIRM|nr:HD domain-containing protein [Candidatus Merdivicinus excrementipullorum]